MLKEAKTGKEWHQPVANPYVFSQKQDIGKKK